MKQKTGHPCNVCASPFRAAVEEALRDGRSMRSVAREYGFSHTGIQRHRKHAPDAASLRTLNRLDPGHEEQHLRILDACASVEAQREVARDALARAIYARAAQSSWARQAGLELARLLGERATW